jgi:large subunit ribosomal protein L4e
MFAPTKTWRRWHRKISKGQRRYATVSALAATAIPSLVTARGHRVEQVSEIPLVIADNDIYPITKTKDAITLLNKINANDDVERVKASKKVRRGKGKSRNRKHVQRKGPLVVYGREDSSIVTAFRNIPGIELSHVSRLNLLQLAPGGHLGRFIIWTESAFAQLDNIFGTFTKESTQKKGWKLPVPKMTNTDLGRLFNSDEIQEAIRPKIFSAKYHPRKKNPLKNFGVMVKLNPYALTQKRRAILASRERNTTRRKNVQRKRAQKTFLNSVLLAPQVPIDFYDQYKKDEVADTVA